MLQVRDYVIQQAHKAGLSAGDHKELNTLLNLLFSQGDTNNDSVLTILEWERVQAMGFDANRKGHRRDVTKPDKDEL